SGGKGNDSPEIIFDQHATQLVVGGLALEDDPFGDDDASPTAWIEVFSDVVDEEHFTPLRFDRKPIMRADATFWRHEGRIRHDHVVAFVPAFLAGKRVVFVDNRIGEAVEIHVYT